MNWFRRRPFVWLLATLLLLLILVPADLGSPAGRMLTGILVSLVYLAGFAVVFVEPRLRRAGLLLGIPALAGSWISFVFPELPRLPVAVAIHSLAIGFLIFTTTVILRAIFRLETVTVDEVAGALCGYLLIGVAFGHAYCLAEELVPGSFRADGDAALGLHDPGRIQVLLTYFSFVTLTTVGYGDITATRGVTRGLAMVEAVVGQFYIAVLIADVIGKKVAQALAGRQSDGKSG
jgi:voltage-gated potassium channel